MASPRPQTIKNNLEKNKKGGLLISKLIAKAAVIKAIIGTSVGKNTLDQWNRPRQSRNGFSHVH